jgi:hypothetical protein
MPTSSTIGMSVPGATSLMDGLSLADQVGNETEEERRKRLAALQAGRVLPPAGASTLTAGFGDALGMR